PTDSCPTTSMPTPASPTMPRSPTSPPPPTSPQPDGPPGPWSYHPTKSPSQGHGCHGCPPCRSSGCHCSATPRCTPSAGSGAPAHAGGWTAPPAVRLSSGPQPDLLRLVVPIDAPGRLSPSRHRNSPGTRSVGVSV